MTAIAEKVLALSKPYLGPATESFLTRQCKVRLNIELGALAPSHIKELAKWVEVGAGLIMDMSKASELAKKIGAL